MLHIVIYVFYGVAIRHIQQAITHWVSYKLWFRVCYKINITFSHRYSYNYFCLHEKCLATSLSAVSEGCVNIFFFSSSLSSIFASFVLSVAVWWWRSLLSKQFAPPPPTYLCDLHGRITDSLTQHFLQLVLIDMGRQIVNAQPGGGHKYVDVFQLFSLHLLNLVVNNIPEKSH